MPVKGSWKGGRLDHVVGREDVGAVAGGDGEGQTGDFGKPGPRTATVGEGP